MSRPRIGFVGAGKVGSVLARAWFRQGYQIVSVYSRMQPHTTELAREIGATAAESASAVVDLSDLVILCVPDDAIASVVEALSEKSWREKAVVHTSGVHGVGILYPLTATGAMTGSLHPALPFARFDHSPDVLKGITFAIESDHPILSVWLSDLIDAVEGAMITLRPESKALYHAALVLTSNYAISLFAASKQILVGLGAGEQAAEEALLQLLRGTLSNLAEQGLPDALTGPLVRGDIGTLKLHLAALESNSPALSAYLTLARLTLPLLAGREVNTHTVEDLLNEWEGK
ncbi:MAG: DUF2520 domain-containing protein [Chloroflexi bacterium]|nr:DUF2520 domain-containing protein [Chloroflexota bacterium]